MPEIEPSVPEPPPPAGARRLWSALSARPGRGQLIAAVLLVMLGYAATVQIQLTRGSDDFAGQRRENLVELLDSLSGASDRAEQQISELQKTRDELTSSSTGSAAAILDAQQRLRDLQVLAGTIAAKGPGITVTVIDPDSAVTAAALLNGIEELRDAGAEAIEVNGSVRLVQSSFVTGTAGAISIDGKAVPAPYVFTAIGSAHTLSEAMRFPGGFVDEVVALGGTATVSEHDTVDITALHPLVQPQYAHATSP